MSSSSCYSCTSWHRSSSRRITPDETNTSAAWFSPVHAYQDFVTRNAPAAAKRGRGTENLAAAEEAPCRKTKKDEGNDRDQIAFKIVFESTERNNHLRRCRLHAEARKDEADPGERHWKFAPPHGCPRHPDERIVSRPNGKQRGLGMKLVGRQCQSAFCQ